MTTVRTVGVVNQIDYMDSLGMFDSDPPPDDETIGRRT